MERDAHYFWVGLFVIIMTVAGFLFAGLFYDDHSQTVFVRYDIHFDTPVQGLERSSEVRYMGIKVGEVSRVFLLPDNAARVGVTIKVQDDTPVNTATIATLRQQGLTGLPFINLSQNNGIKDAGPLPPPVGDGNPVIPTEPSELDALVQKLPDLENNLSLLLNSANEVLSEENRANFAAVLDNLNRATAGVPQLVANLEQTSGQLQQLAEKLGGSLGRSEQELSASMQEARSALAAINRTAGQIEKLTLDVDRLVTANENRVNNLLGEGGIGLQQLLDESRRTAVAIRRLSESLEQNPTQLFSSPAPQGTELPR